MTVDFKTGQFVRVRRVGDDKWVDAQVAIASSNGVSLGLLLDAPVRSWQGYLFPVLPVLRDEQDRYQSILSDEQYEIELVAP